MNYLLLFCTVFVGFLIASSLRKKAVKHITLYLAFSGAFLLAITIFELLPEVFSSNKKNTPLFIMLGLLIQICLEFFSKGAEHGHFHHSSTNSFPVLLFISLSIHALIEGMPISSHDNLIYAIIIHKLPIAIILSLFLYESGYPKFKVILLISIFGAMTPLGLFLMNVIPAMANFTTEITALVIGVILHVSTVILFESSKNHSFNLAKFVTILLAITLAYFL